MCAMSRTRTTATLGIICYSYLLKPQPCFILLSHFPQTNLKKCELTRQMERLLNLLDVTHVAVWFGASGVCKTRGLSKKKKKKKVNVLPLTVKQGQSLFILLVIKRGSKNSGVPVGLQDAPPLPQGLSSSISPKMPPSSV